MLVSQKPRFSSREASDLARDIFGIEVVATKELPGERDQNWRLLSTNGDRHVLKISHPDEDPLVLAFVNQALLRLSDSPLSKLVPGIRPTICGHISIPVERGRISHWVRIVTYLEGHPLGALDITPGDRLVSQVGRILGQLDGHLSDYRHPAMYRHFYWDSKHAPSTVGANLPYLETDSKRRLVESCLRRYRDRIAPRVRSLRQTVIHNDANDFNLLVDDRNEPKSVTGVIDFGDLVSTYTVCELANACAYLMMGQQDPLSVAFCAAHGYDSTNRLRPEEIEVLFELILIRLCLTVSNAARQKRDDPDNEYLVVSERPAWELLERLANLPAKQVDEQLIRTLKG